MNSNTLKKYQSQLSKLKAKQQVIESELTDCNNRYSQVKSEIIDVQTKINALTKNNRLIVSEHATVRLFERLYNFNTNEMHQKITADISDLYQQLGDGIFPVDCIGLRAVVKNGVIVTFK